MVRVGMGSEQGDLANSQVFTRWMRAGLYFHFAESGRVCIDTYGGGGYSDYPTAIRTGRDFDTLSIAPVYLSADLGGYPDFVLASDFLLGLSAHFLQFQENTNKVTPIKAGLLTNLSNLVPT